MVLNLRASESNSPIRNLTSIRSSYTGVSPGDQIKIQLNSGVAGESGSIAGLMFDVIPEPTSARFVGIGQLGPRSGWPTPPLRRGYPE